MEVNLSNRGVNLSNRGVNLNNRGVNLSNRGVNLSTRNVNHGNRGVNLSNRGVKVRTGRTLGAWEEEDWRLGTLGARLALGRRQRPPYNTARSVRALSGTLLMMIRELWRAVVMNARAALLLQDQV